MSNNLTDFLIELGEDPIRLERFRRRPTMEMRRAGLSERERAAITSGNGLHIRQALSPEGQPFVPIWVQQSALRNVRPI